MSDDMKHIVLANMNVKQYSWPTYVSQGSAATDLRVLGLLLFPQILSEFNNEKIMKIGPHLLKLS